MRAKEALDDPADTEAHFGIELGGPFRDPATGSTTTPGSIRSGRAMLLELAFPLDVGTEIDFNTNVGFSLDGDNAPAMLYAEVENTSKHGPATTRMIPLRSPRGTVTEVEPLSIAIVGARACCGVPSLIRTG